MVIEPCCYITQLDGMLATIEDVRSPSDVTKEKKPEVPKLGVAHFFTNGDFGLPEFMDYFVGRSPGCDVFLSLVRVETITIHSIIKMMEWKDRFGNFMIHSFTLLSQGADRVEVVRLLSEYRTAGRLFICEDKESFRCLTVGNERHQYVLNGSINQSCVYAMQMFTLTTTQELYDEAMGIFNAKKRIKRLLG